MMNYFYNESLEFEVYTIGYRTSGESIVFLTKSDGKPTFSGVVDCATYRGNSQTKKILRENGIKKVDFICWSHPHDDHTRGLIDIIEKFSSPSTLVVIPRMRENIRESICREALGIYGDLFREVITNGNIKYKFQEIGHGDDLRRISSVYYGEKGNFRFNISCLSPDSTISLRDEYSNTRSAINAYSISILISFGIFQFLLPGDVENKQIGCVDEYDFDKPIDFIKIPHHGSNSSSDMLSKISALTNEIPKLSVATVYKVHSLPEDNVLRRYMENGSKVFICGGDGRENFGIHRARINIAEMANPTISYKMIGNCVEYS